MASIADLRKKALDINTLRDRVKNDGKSPQAQEDERIWRPYFDKEKGTAFARIRFLPAHPEEDLPFVKTFSHGFKGDSGKWYINNSLTTLGKEDPIGVMNSKLWNSGVESDKELARQYKRKANYFANVLVLEDPANPENEGKVFIYRYGAVVQKFIEDSISPEFEDETPINPFDPFEGASFTIRMRTQDGYVKYDKSKWGEPEPLASSDEELERIWNECHRLQDFLSEDNFKSYDELKNQLFNVLGPRVGKGPDGNGVPTVEGLDNPPEAKKTNSNTKSRSVSEEVDDSIPDHSSSSSDDSDVSLENEINALFSDD